MSDHSPDRLVAELTGSTIREVSAETENGKPRCLAIILEDGALVYIDALYDGTLELAYLDPDEHFELGRSAMEEEAWHDQERREETDD